MGGWKIVSDGCQLDIGGQKVYDVKWRQMGTRGDGEGLTGALKLGFCTRGGEKERD